jgi:hypothetical protein
MPRKPETGGVTSLESRMQQVIIDGVTQVLQEFLEQEVTTKLGRPKRSPRRMSSQARPIDWQCACCGCSDANQFTRDGHYRRSLETGWGHLDVLRVPMLECQRYKHDVVAQFALLEKYQRFWLDAPHRAIFGSGLSRSLRQRETRNGQPRWEQAWDCAPSMSGSISWKLSWLKCIAGRSRRYLRWCSSMASG